jgi:hypothetical protein
MKKQISVQNFSDEVAIISTPPRVAKDSALLRNLVISAHVNNYHLAISTKYAQISDSSDSIDSISNFSPQGNNFKRKARPN